MTGDGTTGIAADETALLFLGAALDGDLRRLGGFTANVLHERWD
jgi:hypothetical protein